MKSGHNEPSKTKSSKVHVLEAVLATFEKQMEVLNLMTLS